MNLPQTARYLILLIVAILIFFGLGTLANLGSHPDLMGMFIFYAFAMFIEAAVLLFCFFGLKRRSKRIFWLTIAILAVNVIATIFDQIGMIDILYMLLNLIAIILLYLSRNEFLPE
jgi:lysylphosphatidylglycerol synthetase-like protein (DUF2156 family)